MLAASERRSEVMAVIGDATSEQEALASVQALLQIDQVAAGAVLEMQLRRFPHEARERLRAELDDLLMQQRRS